MANDLHDLSLRLNKLAAGLSGEPMRDVLTKLGMEAKKDAAAAARSDLGGDAMFTGGPKRGSGWKRAGALEAAFSLHRDLGGVTIHRGQRSAGPWRVAEEGRNQGNASGVSGPGISQRTGLTSRTKTGKLRKVQARRGRRWNGTTRGKNTWTDATDLIVARTPDRALDAVFEAARGIVGT